MKILTAKNRKSIWILCFLCFFSTQFRVTAQQESGIVTGTVVSEKGELLTGVTLKATNTNTKENFTTITNEKGIFVFRKMRIGSNYTITASYVGYETNIVQSFNVKDANNSILIKLNPSSNSLDQVVVIGYGTQKRETVTGAISTVNAKDFNSGQINDPITLIAGKVAGLSLSNTDRSDPNSTADFSLRGPATATGLNSGPLIIIDGVPGGDLQSIAPSDIASIDVLKDGSAAAIYGSRATAGVIIITTKRGRPGEIQVNYSGYVTTSTILKKYDVLSAQQYKQFGHDNGFQVDNQGASTNWFNAVTRTPISHSQNLSVSGGTDRTTYYASVNYRNNQGIDLRSNREFVNGTFRLNTKALNNKLDFGLIMVNSFDTRNFANYGAIAQSLNMNPTYPIYNPDGTFFEHDVQYHLQWNPVANIYQNSYSTKEKRFLGTANAAYHILPSLTASVTYSLIKKDVLDGSFSDINDYFQLINGTNGQASRSEDNFTSNVLETTLGYDKVFGDHHLNAIAGYSYQNDFDENFGAGNNNFVTNAYGYYNLGAGNALNTLDPNFNRSGVFIYSNANERTILAFFGRIIYDYKQKYLLNVSIRREGASVLGANNKWGYFPGVSAGWILSKENFLAGSQAIKFLKLRAGYGVTGNQGALSPYQSLETIGSFYSGTQDGYFGTPSGGTWILPYGPTINNPNPLLEWETKTEINLGVDFALLKNGWLNGSLDFYDRKINHLINNFTAQLPSQIQPTIFANAGTMENKGVELLLNAKLISNKNFTWNAIFTGAYNKNEIISISSNQFFGTAQGITRVQEDDPIQRLAPGEPLAVFYGPVFAGITSDGTWTFRNSKGEAVPLSDLSADDYAYLGNSIPKYSYGLTNTFSIGRFDASLLLKGAAGFKAVNAKRMFHENWSYYSRNNLFVSALTTKLNDAPTFSSYYIENGAYLKAENLTVGYTLPVQNSAYIKNVHFYLTVADLFTITKFSGTDPELQINFYPTDYSQETDNGPGLESNYSYYPTTRVWTLGVNINF
ncbi:MAG: SusC/RagA family TonB-linked outer membrane protein [Chitinophagaceae bacterium]